MADHRYWRLEIFNWGIQDYTLLAEVEFRESAGGSDVTGSGTASAASEYDGSGTYAASKAFDNNTGTSWASLLYGTKPEWLAYDFGSGNAYDIEEVTITARSSWSGDSELPTNIALAYSDNGTDWTTKYLWRHITGWSAGGTLTFNTSSGFYIPKYNGSAKRYWLLELHKSGQQYAILREAELRETSGGSDVTGSGTPSAYQSNASYPITNLFDNDLDTLWSTFNTSGSNHTYEWFSYDFGAGVTKNITEIAITSHTSYGSSAIWAYFVLCSDNGSDWEWAWADIYVNDWAVWSGGETIVFTSSFIVSSWSGKINGIAPANIAKVNGIAIANIAKINGV